MPVFAFKRLTSVSLFMHDLFKLLDLENGRLSFRWPAMLEGRPTPFDNKTVDKLLTRAP
jgi:hypothetical protein